MKRLTISVDADLADAFDDLMRRRGYGSRSEAIRALVRADQETVQLPRDRQGPCAATLSYLYDHSAGLLTLRLRQLRHEHCELIIATTHVHIDQGHRLETMMLRGQEQEIRVFAESLMTLPGVMNASLNLVPVESSAEGIQGSHQAARLLM